MRPDPTFDVKQYLRVLRRRIGLLLIPVVLLTGMVGGSSLLIPDVFQPQAQVLVRPEMDPVRGLAVNSRISQQIETIIDEIMRLDGLQAVLDKLRAQKPANLSDEEATRNFQRYLLMRPGRRGGNVVVQVVFQGSPRDWAIAVTNAFADELEERGTKVVSETLVTTMDFLTDSIKEYDQQKADLDGQERSILNLLERELGDIAPQSAAKGLGAYVISEMADNDYETKRLDVLISGLEARLRLVSEELQRMPTMLAVRDPNQRGTNQAIAALEQMVAQSRMNRVAMEMRYTENHPALRELDKQVAELNDQLTVLYEQAETATRDFPNPSYENVQQERVRVQTELDAAKANRAVVAARSAKLRAFYRRVPELEQELTQIQQKRSLVTETRSQLLGRLNNLELSNRFEDKNTQRFEVIHALEQMQEPVLPNRKKIAILGFAAGLFIGLSFMLLAEYLDHAVRSEADLRRYVDAPVLAVLPRTMR